MTKSVLDKPWSCPGSPSVEIWGDDQVGSGQAMVMSWIIICRDIGGKSVLDKPWSCPGSSSVEILGQVGSGQAMIMSWIIICRDMGEQPSRFWTSHGHVLDHHL